MKKYLLLIATLAVAFAGCSQKTTQTISLDTIEDSVAQSVGYLLASDAIYSDLVEYAPMIDEAVNDIFNGKEEKLHQVYAYINAVEIVNKAYSELDMDLDRDIVLAAAHEILDKVSDSLDFEKVQVYEQSAQSLILKYVSDKMSKVHEQFLADVDKMNGIQKSETGLRYFLDKKGTKIGNTDKVKVRYVLYDYSRNIIDQSKGEPFEFQMPSGVVPGFAESVAIAGYGGKIRSWIPANLGYGDTGAGADIAPGQTLVFEIEVLEK